MLRLRTALNVVRQSKAQRHVSIMSIRHASSSIPETLRRVSIVGEKASKFDQNPTLFAVIALVAAAAPTVLCDESPRPLTVQEVITLYEQVDANMRILSRQLMETLAHEIAMEEESDGKRKLSVDERAIQMSETFEQLLAQVQESVFRNHYVTKEQVADAMARMENGDLVVSAKEAELIHEYIRKLGRMRWECTGSREPIRRRQRNTSPKPLSTPIPRHVLVKMMESLIAALTKEMELILSNLKAQNANLKDNQIRQEIATSYMNASKIVTDAVAAHFNVSVEDFQAALAYFHDDPSFQSTMKQLTDAQHERFVALGL